MACVIYGNMLCLNVFSESDTEFKIPVYYSYHKAGASGRGELLQTTTAADHGVYLDLWVAGQS